MLSLSDDLNNERHSDTIVWAVHMCFNSKLYADVMIRLGEIELPAHSIVLASQSEYFKKALDCPMKEGIERKFEFSEGSMHAHWRLFEYIYRGEYSHDAAAPLDSIADDEELSKDIRVYQLADYFQIENLKIYALENLKTRVEKLWVSENFVDCIRDVYGMSREVSYGIRMELVEIARRHLVELWDKKSFRNLVREGGDFVIDMMKGMVSRCSEGCERSR